MRYLVIVLTFIVTGCAQLTHGQTATPVTLDAKQKLMSMDCSGAANDWGVCFSAAKNSCPNGYDISDKQENSRGGRILTYQCK